MIPINTSLPTATSPIPTPPTTSPMSTPLQLPYPELSSNALSTRAETNNLILDQQKFTETVFAQPEIDNNINYSFYDNTIEDNIMNDSDFEAPSISNEEIINTTNSRATTRSMRNILGDSEFLSSP